MTVTPRIIIQEEEELRQTGVSAELLSQLSSASNVPRPAALAGGGPADPALARKADFIARNVARHPASTPAEETGSAPPSVEQIRRQNELARVQRTAEAEEFFAKGQRAEAEGKGGVAKIWYQMAARRGRRVAAGSRRAFGDLGGLVGRRKARRTLARIIHEPGFSRQRRVVTRSVHLSEARLFRKSRASSFQHFFAHRQTPPRLANPSSPPRVPSPPHPLLSLPAEP